MKKISIFCISIILSLVSLNNVLAQAGNYNTVTGVTGGVASTKLENPLSVDSPQALVGQVINSVMGIVGSIALLMFVYGGLTWMTSAGSPEKVKKGKGIIIWSAIGLAIIFMSYGLVRFVLNSIAGGN